MEPRDEISAVARTAPEQATPAGVGQPPPTWPYVERRKTPDRRARPTGFWAGLFGPKRRRGGRRRADREPTYVDLYDAVDALLVLGIFVLNLLDAALTLHHLDRGAREVNPLMDALLRISPELFVAEKAVVGAVCVVALVVHKTTRMARIGLWTFFGFYGALFLYHLYLLFALP